MWYRDYRSLGRRSFNLSVKHLKSGPMGGDLQMGALVADGEMDLVVFFSDPLQAQPHDPDIQALLRICNVWNIPIANSSTTADFIVSAPLFMREYALNRLDYKEYLNRNIPD